MLAVERELDWIMDVFVRLLLKPLYRESFIESESNFASSRPDCQFFAGGFGLGFGGMFAQPQVRGSVQ